MHITEKYLMSNAVSSAYSALSTALVVLNLIYIHCDYSLLWLY